MAYHQAQTLTALEPRDGVAWGVIAYVDARRADMVEAVSAINLAGQFAPDSKFVQSTAGEILAWYDVKADKSQLSDSAKSGLTRLRALLAKDTAFTQAYDTAQTAYQAQAAATSAPAATVAAGSTGYAPTVSATPYYVDYYYDYGPGWVEPAPWCWWEPLGYWYGFDFFPEFPVVVFNNHEFFEHEHHFELNEFGEHGHAFFHHDWDNPVVWHRGQHGRSAFFGLPAHPAPGVTRFAREDFLHQRAGFANAMRTAPHSFALAAHPLGGAPVVHAVPSPFGVAPSLPRQSHPAGGQFAHRFQGLGPMGAGSHGALLLEHPEFGFHNAVPRRGLAGGGLHGGFYHPPMEGGFQHGFAGGEFHQGLEGREFHGGFGGGFHRSPTRGGFRHGFSGGGFHHGFAGGGVHGGGEHHG